jgi:hypothetical protein
MKKLLVLICLTLLAMFVNPTSVHAETLEYPFDDITIVSAYRFQVLIDVLPNSTSFLSGQVDLNDALTVYVGSLVMNLAGVQAMESKIVIVTNDLGVDLARWIVNTYYWYGVDHERFEFSSHIQIDPLIGVVKNLDMAWQLAIVEKLAAESYRFLDNLSQVYPMIADSYEFIPDLAIVISAYVPVV